MATAKHARNRKSNNQAAETHFEGIASQKKAKEFVVSADSSDAIRRRAYELYLERGGTPGTDVEDWLRAEREILETKRIA